MFFVVLRASYFSVQGQRGGCTRKKRGGVPAQHSLNSFVFCGLPLIFGFENDDTEKSEETIAPPPKRGVPTDPDSGTQYRAPIPAPGGRYRLYLSLREGSEKTPFPLALHRVGSVLAVKGSASPLRALDGSGPIRKTRCLRGKKGGGRGVRRASRGHVT